MQFNSQTDNLDLVSDIKFWCGIASTDTTSYSLKAMARNCNFGVDRVVTILLRNDQTWQWDDLNNTDTPIGRADLVSGQLDYSIATTHLKILRVDIKDSNGNIISLNKKDRKDLTDSELNAPDGVPTSYDKFGNSIRLNPAPNYSYVKGLITQIQRGGVHFDDTTTDTQEPGFASPWHRLVSLYSSEDWLAVNGPEKRLIKVQAKIASMEESIADFYKSRNVDEKQNLSLRKENYGEPLSRGDDFNSGNPIGF